MIGMWRNLTKVSSVQVATLFGMLLVAGCGEGVDTKPTAKVTGNVTYDGKPVTGGSLMFSPTGGSNNQPGKAGDATIKSDGTFTVTTYSSGDGAVVGQHRIAFMPPAPENAPAATPGGAHSEAPAAPFAGLVPKTTEITVAKGDNKIEVELVKQGPPK